MTAVMPAPTTDATDLDYDGDPLGYAPCSDCWYCESTTQRQVEEGDYDRGHCECPTGAECPLAPYSAFDDF